MTAIAGLSPRNILVVKLADLGDLLTATPALRALRTRFPAARITALVTGHTVSLLDGNDAVDATIEFPKVAFDHPRELITPAAIPKILAATRLGVQLAVAQYDVVILLHHLITSWGRAKYRALLAATRAPIRVGLDNGTGRFLTHAVLDEGFGGRHEVDYQLDVVGLLGARIEEPRMELPLTADELRDGSRFWERVSLDPHRTAVVHPGSGAFSLARRWSPERFGAVADALAAHGLSVVLVEGPSEVGLASQVQRHMSSSAAVLDDASGPRALAATLSGARLFVGNDSGVMHLAAAVGVPTVGVFGLTNHRAWGPYPPSEHRVVRLDLPCSPCCYRGQSLGTPEGCPPRTCLENLEPGLVAAAARDLIQSRPGGSQRAAAFDRPSHE